MPNVGKHEITEEQIRDYVLRNRQDALSYPVLQAIAYDYLNKVIRKAQKFDKWPKDIKDMCYSQGFRQDKETGLPVYDDNGVMAWSERAKQAERSTAGLQARLSHAGDAIDKALRILNDNEWDEYCDSQTCDSFQEAINMIRQEYV